VKIAPGTSRKSMPSEDEAHGIRTLSSLAFLDTEENRGVTEN
jgi:hypothetical protein